RNAERVHRLADDVFAQHRPDRGAPVAAGGERRPARSLQLDVDAVAGRGDLLAEEDRAAVAERGEVAELVAGVGLGDGRGALREGVAAENRGAVRTVERVRVEPERDRERP